MNNEIDYHEKPGAIMVFFLLLVFVSIFQLDSNNIKCIGKLFTNCFLFNHSNLVAWAFRVFSTIGLFMWAYFASNPFTTLIKYNIIRRQRFYLNLINKNNLDINFIMDNISDYIDEMFSFYEKILYKCNTLILKVLLVPRDNKIENKIKKDLFCLFRDEIIRSVEWEYEKNDFGTYEIVRCKDKSFIFLYKKNEKDTSYISYLIDLFEESNYEWELEFDFEIINENEKNYIKNLIRDNYKKDVPDYITKIDGTFFEFRDFVKIKYKQTP